MLKSIWQRELALILIEILPEKLVVSRYDNKDNVLKKEYYNKGISECKHKIRKLFDGISPGLDLLSKIKKRGIKLKTKY